MDPGKNSKTSPILEAICEAERGTTGEIRVHLSKRWFEKNPYQYAENLFLKYGMMRTTQRNAILFYINLRRRKFAIIADSEINKVVDPKFWRILGNELATQLRSTHSEKAIAEGVRMAGEMLKKYFPLD